VEYRNVLKAKRPRTMPSKEIAQRMRTFRLRDPIGISFPAWAKEQNAPICIAASVAISQWGRNKAVTAWAIKLYISTGYLPSLDDVERAVDSGAIGKWADGHYKVTVVPKRRKENAPKYSPSQLMWKIKGGGIRANARRHAEIAAKKGKAISALRAHNENIKRAVRSAGKM